MGVLSSTTSSSPSFCLPVSHTHTHAHTEVHAHTGTHTPCTWGRGTEQENGEKGYVCVCRSWRAKVRAQDVGV